MRYQAVKYEKGKRYGWRYAWGGLPVLSLLGIVAWIFWPAARLESAESAPAATPPRRIEGTVTEVEAVPVARADLPLLAEATGHLQPWRQVEVSVEAAGKVVWRGVEEGQRVDQGDVLLRLDDRDQQLELAEAEVELLKVQANYAVGFAFQQESSHPAEDRSRWRSVAAEDAEYLNAQRLFAEGIIAEKALIRARRSYEAARTLTGEDREEIHAATSGLTQAEQRAQRARLALARTRLEAPFAGKIADVEIEVGQHVGGGQSCFLLLDETRMAVDVAVLEADIVGLRPGAPARVKVPALQGKVFQGTVHNINPRVDSQTGTGRVKVIIDNHGGPLMPGLFAFVELEARRLHNRLLVPDEALLVRQGRDLVFRLENGRALWTYVKTGERSTGWVEILDGLTEADVVAVAGHFALAHDAPVAFSLRSAPPPGAEEGETGRGVTDATGEASWNG